ncbi:hypothetical protein shim_29220 [Shimia sp. SK013]|uniref:DUF2092 domain-containing protein n=1 Tax=Shimia sp. SK013 TaxID=1389006 RepID=UPI0006B40AE9|nr:DUF2092 domain-containing protein [Shimia sp. SK013]KPA21006.1 hypothetical protein shim_29220 [Shimia sp. SK013]
MRRFYAKWLLAFVLALSAGAGFAQEAQEDGGEPADPSMMRLDPRAIDIVESVATVLTAHETLAVNWLVSYDQVIDGREKMTLFRSGRTMMVRPDKYYAYVEQEEGLREFFFDGYGLTVHLPELNAYTHMPYFGTFDELTKAVRDEHSESLPVWKVFVPDFADQFLGDITAAAYLGIKRVAGIEVHHVAMSSYQEDLQMWITTDPVNPVLKMIVGTNPYEQGWPQYRAYFSDWDFAPEIAEDSFTFYPDDEDDRLVWPKRNSDVTEGEN